ncbi:membrane-bound lytic murein transglycosylase MltC [Enterovibrio makurazakiensis]|uniref:membrane-bound lytic murein transglycosylase MltC n=1 Tax=Enterovibrio makurazakiensis TaxID=2910232 RepID=UPI003D203038
MRKAVLLLCTALFTGCAIPPESNDIVTPPIAGQPLSDANKKAIATLFSLLAKEAKKHWGDDDYVESSKHRYVKYLDGYQTRAHIDFEAGKIYVSTVSQHQPMEKLHKAIVQTVLMPADPKDVEQFSDKDVKLTGKPFFMGQIVDQEGKSIEWEWRANRFAGYMIENKLQSKAIKQGKAYYVQIDMVKDHLEQREYQYANLVRDASKRYDIPEDLIYAVIKTESSFNPYAVSHAGAYGLMQVIPKTAGADVFNLVKKKPGMPTKEYLFDPASNIDTGTAYLHILKTRYLREVTNPSSRHFSMISAYNSGTGGVLSTFHTDRKKAMVMLNQKSPTQVYDALTTEHPKDEARRYLQKVLYFQKDFSQGKI